MSAASGVVLRDPGPLARLEAVKADKGAPAEIFMRMTDASPARQRLQEIAKAWGLPAGQFVLWFTTVHADLYDAALKVLADEMAQDALEIADEQKEATAKNGEKYDPEVPRDKLRVDTRMRLLEKWDRARYGNKDSGPSGGVTVVVDRSCGGTVSVQSGNSQVVVTGVPAGGGVSPGRVIGSAEALAGSAENQEI